MNWRHWGTVVFVEMVMVLFSLYLVFVLCFACSQSNVRLTIEWKQNENFTSVRERFSRRKKASAPSARSQE